MHIFVTLTSQCNLKCSYCYGKCCDDFGSNGDRFGEIDYSLPKNIAYASSGLKSFSEREALESVIFYGGEPLLRVDRIQEIMDTVPAEKFMIQTNGLFLDTLELKYLQRLHTILLSVDGDESLTDSYRGRGVYRRVIENTHLIREKGFKGELIARMTVGKQTRIDEQVWHLLFGKECVFDSVHWQLDEQFWHNDFDPAGFSMWTQFDYGPRLRNLIDR